jgi:hypothetical protein
VTSSPRCAMTTSWQQAPPRACKQCCCTAPMHCTVLLRAVRACCSTTRSCNLSVRMMSRECGLWLLSRDFLTTLCYDHVVAAGATPRM